MEKVLQSLIISQTLIDIYNPINVYFINNIKIYLIYSIILFIIYLLLPSIILFIFIFLYYFNLDLNYLRIYNYNICSSLIVVILDINKLTYGYDNIEKNIFIETIVKIILFIFLLICFLKYNKFQKIKKYNIVIFINILIILYYLDSKYISILYYFGFFHSPLSIIRKSALYGFHILNYWLYISFLIYIIL